MKSCLEYFGRPRGQQSVSGSHFGAPNDLNLLAPLGRFGVQLVPLLEFEGPICWVFLKVFGAVANMINQIFLTAVPLKLERAKRKTSTKLRSNLPCILYVFSVSQVGPRRVRGTFFSILRHLVDLGCHFGAHSIWRGGEYKCFH